ncbi:UTP--glucose-1-phosphate uridylyltransferase [Pradoshia eiseniae]|uniref:UTP--glucose-1-phosphate uridylyltransferase n=1 Tax=Pradoshia eiseniae TaxID=2064768 RepID=A0A2S7N0H4_9BACI|nr:UTP--glucose-1-phosphate uridylyltransferase GalU [Pradoshia eiseniae]PQD95591.1 UTP--glucose-1-phosphate uridylyltransferase [Pradoshia eiseniae]
MKIKKAIIPAAGLGTRLLPATKALPKEMLPIIDKPMIQYIVEEAIESGIEDILIVTGKGKRAIEDHFDHSHELEQRLFQTEKYELLKKVQHSSKVDIHYIRQKEPKGLGHAIWCARKFIGSEPFAVLLGDDIVQAEIPCMKQLIDKFEETGSAVIGIKEVPREQTHLYGIIDGPLLDNGLVHIQRMVEKPMLNPPSNYAIMGRYILTPEIFSYLETQEAGAGGEIQLTDAMEKMAANQLVYGYEFSGNRYDVGEKLGYILTTIKLAMQDKELREKVIEEIELFMPKVKTTI